MRRDRVDVFFAPGYSAPLLAGVPFVVAIHDLSFIAHPEWFGWREGTRRRLLARWSAARAARVITISEFSRHEIVTHLGLPGERDSVVRPGVDAVNVRGHATGTNWSSTSDRSSIDVISLRSCRAFAQVAATRPQARLEIVGNDRTHPPQQIANLVSKSPAADRIRSRAWVSDEDLDALYARASVFAFLSEYEGFGLTPLEALAAGASPLVLDTPVARETLGDAAVFVARPEPRAVAEAIDALLDPSSDARRAVLAAAPSVLARYRWPDAAAAVLSTLEEAARR